jgi:hypothetical protein
MYTFLEPDVDLLIGVPPLRRLKVLLAALIGMG